MTITQPSDINNELTNFLRTHTTDPKNRATYATTTLSGDGTTTEFEIGSGHAVQLISGVSVGGTDQNYGTDYDFNLKTTGSIPTVTFTTAITSGGSAVVTYAHGEGWIFPDYPRKDISLDSYPRIGYSITSREEPLGTDGTATEEELDIDLRVYATSNKQLTDLLQEVRSGLLANTNNFYHIPYLHPAGFTPRGMEPGRHDKISVQGLRAKGKFIIND